MRAQWVVRGAGVVYVVGVALLALGVYVDLPGPLGAFGDPGASWPVAVCVLAGLAAYCTWRWVNRRRSLPFAVVLLALGIGTVLVCATASYARCPDPGLSTGWSVVTRVVGLVTNNYAIDQFDPVKNPACRVGGVPLALQFARLAQLLVLLVAFTSAVTALLRTQLDRVAIRWSQRVTVALGVDADSVGLLPRIAHGLSRSTLVAVTADPLAPWVVSARSAGWRILVEGAEPVGTLRRLLTRRGGRLALRDLYVFTTPDFVAAQQMVDLVGTAGRSTAQDPVRVLVRSDNPWHAEHLRAQALSLGAPAVVDTVSKYEVCAHDLLEDVRARGGGLLVVTGHSDLTVAVLDASAQAADESAFGDDEPDLDLVVSGAAARASLDEQHAIAAWYGRSQLSATLDPRDDLAAVVAERRGARAPAVIFTGPPSAEDQRAAAVLATRLPDCLVYVPYADLTGIGEQPVIGQARAYGASLVTRSVVGRWERIAQQVHAQFIAAFPDPGNPARRPWADLDPFYRESTIRQVTLLISSAIAVGRVWRATGEGPGELGEGQLDEMARLDHESWFHFLRAHGWTWGPTRDVRRKRHPDLVPWGDLPAESVAKTRQGVEGSLAALATLGYRSFDDPSAAWVRLRRRGEVTAVRRDRPWSWTTSDGAVMRGGAGDWEVTDDDGATRSITASIFARTHEQVAGDRWRRTGEIQGRQARPGEVVHSLEGDQTARAGQWVLRGVEGEEWLVPADRLEATYDRIES